MNLILIIEFDEDLPSCEGDAATNCMNVKEDNSIDPNEWWVYMMVLVALFVVFRALAASLLVQKAKRFY